MGGGRGTKQSRSLSELFLADFELQNWSVSQAGREEVLATTSTLFSLYTADLVLCHLVIGRQSLDDIVKLMGPA